MSETKVCKGCGATIERRGQTRGWSRRVYCTEECKLIDARKRFLDTKEEPWYATEIKLNDYL